jgi:hypothetical protein
VTGGTGGVGGNTPGVVSGGPKDPGQVVSGGPKNGSSAKNFAGKGGGGFGSKIGRVASGVKNFARAAYSGGKQIAAKIGQAATGAKNYAMSAYSRANDGMQRFISASPVGRVAAFYGRAVAKTSEAALRFWLAQTTHGFDSKINFTSRKKKE